MLNKITKYLHVISHLLHSFYVLKHKIFNSDHTSSNILCVLFACADICSLTTAVLLQGDKSS